MKLWHCVANKKTGVKLSVWNRALKIEKHNKKSFTSFPNYRFNLGLFSAKIGNKTANIFFTFVCANFFRHSSKEISIRPSPHQQLITRRHSTHPLFVFHFHDNRYVIFYINALKSTFMRWLWVEYIVCFTKQDRKQS